MNHAPELRVWVELFLALASGVAVIVGLAAIIAPRLRIAAWQRTVWQVSTLGLALLLICELTGIARGVTGWSRERLTTPPAPPAAHAPAGFVPVEPMTERVDECPPSWSTFLASDLPPLAPLLEDTLFSEATSGGEGDESGHARKLGVPAALSAVRHGSTETIPAVANSRNQSLDTSMNLEQISWLPAWLWLVGSVVLLGRLLVGRLLLEALRWRHRAIGHSLLHERVQSIARRLGMPRRVHVVVVPGLLGPIALGTLRPTVGLPENFTEQFEEGQQEAMLAHELGHLAAYDCAWHTLADLVVAALWWQPLVWWCRHELRSTSEWAADEACLAVPGGPESLAACLVKLGGQLVSRRPSGWTGIEGNGFRSSLGRRVERLLHMSDRQWPRPQRISSSLVKLFGPAVMVTVALVSTGWSRPPETSQGETMFQSIRQSWRQSLAALMFAGAVGTSDDSALFAADDPFAEKAVVKKDAEQDRPSAKDDDDDKKSAKDKRDNDDDEFRRKKIAKDKEDSDDDKRSIKRKGKDSDGEKGESLDQLRAKLKQLEAENAKLRSAVQEKEAATSFKTDAGFPVKEKLPPIKSTKPVDPPPKKGDEKQSDEQQQILAKWRAVQEQIFQLQKEGRKEEAEKLTHAEQDLRTMFFQLRAKHGKEQPKEHSPIAERIEQLKQQIEESTRAGKKDHAEALRQELEKTVQHAHHLQTKGFQKPDLAAPHELGAVIKELGEQVHQLRAEVEELRRLVKDRGGDKK